MSKKEQKKYKQKWHIFLSPFNYARGLMRLICTITDHKRENPYELSYYLTSLGIQNECEESAGGFHIWVYDEDRVEEAQTLYEKFKQNPEDPIYRAKYPSAIQHQENVLNPPPAQLKSDDEKKTVRRRFLSPAPYGPITVAILLVTIALFIWAKLQGGMSIPPQIPGVLPAPLLPPINRHLIYDYPTYYELRDRLLKLYTPQQIEQKQSPSPDALRVLEKLKRTPVWIGIYDRFVNHFQNGSIPLLYHGSMFEKIRMGEVWRIFTPALLHFDILHIFFNLLWFILLANQIEYRLGWFRYCVLILLTGIVSNTAQYLMSGPFFLGLSGIVVGMAAFIWARQQLAPWEGYLLNRITLIFLGIFVLGMFALQIVFFFLQLTGKLQISIGIANTAHVAGGIVGYLLGRFRYFCLRPQPYKL
jgi:GlpG protein